MKKLATLVLAVCLIVPCFSMLTHAANSIQFTDPSTKAGETVEVTCKVKRESGDAFGKVTITMKYDTSMLKFQGGTGITEDAAGTITYKGDASNEASNTHAFTMQFTALKAGTAEITIVESSVQSLSGTTLNYTNGYSKITIAEGEGTTTVDTATEPATDETNTTISGTTGIEVNGESYTITSVFPESDIPKGYEAATLDYDTTTYNVVYNANTGLYLAYLVGTDNVGKFFMYVEEDATFAPFEQIDITDSATITLLSDVSGIVLPEEYVEIVLTMNGQDFPAWNNTSNVDFYVLYAMDGNGEESLYQYDKTQGTYQRFTAPEVVADDKSDSGFIGKLTNLLENHLDYVILGTGLTIIIFVLIIIVLGIKLYNRNAELDEIYDEYDIDPEDEDTDDDVIIDLSDDDDYDYDDDDDDDEDDEDMSFLVREGMREVFPEVDDEDEEDEEDTIANEDEEDAIVNVVEEDTEDDAVKVVADAKDEKAEVVKADVEEKVTAETVAEEPADMQESLGKVVDKVSETASEPVEEDEEDTLAKVLAKQKKADKEAKEQYYDGGDDVLENFSMDFIDLDD